MAIALPELITENWQDYEKLAVSLASNPQYLADLKNKLAANRLTTALFNTPQYTRDLENAFLYMHQRCLSGLPAEDFDLSV
jgi:predicted O-linked N-acetylglucosamine transferase (SPINDLY family)